ncbi:hypothetical protein N8310_06165 [Pseudomonadota bacterium]|nr:hypothetical protein [Pseudomonadota bacterium]
MKNSRTKKDTVRRSKEGKFLFEPVSRYVMYDNKTKLWVNHRKRAYLIWFKFLQHCHRDKNFKVDWSKYQGWGGWNLLMDTDFDTWWNRNWVNLFAVKEKGETPKFPTNTKTKISNYNSLRLYLLVYEYQLKYPAADTYEISQRIKKREPFKRYPVPSFTEGLGFDGGVINKRTVKRRMSDYKKRANEIMENVCNGVFP